MLAEQWTAPALKSRISLERMMTKSSSRRVPLSRATSRSGVLPPLHRQKAAGKSSHWLLNTRRYWKPSVGLGQHGHDVVVLPVKSDGLLDLQVLEAALGCQTLLVSVMLANNEIGVIQPLPEISQLCHAVGAFVHTDATQAAGRIKVDVDELGVDLLSLSAHKIYGPNGIGALYVRNRPDLKIVPTFTGGAQERGIRPGTVPVPLAVGIGAACTIANRQLEDDAKRITKLGQMLLQDLMTHSPALRLFGHSEQRIPGNLNLGFPGILGESLVEAVSSEVAISTGAACATGSPEPSHVLMALGLDPEVAATGVRISLGRFTTDDEISAAIRSLRRALQILARGG